MNINPENAIVSLCAQGMEKEGEGDKETAITMFQLAWETATSDYERCIAAHYVARHQDNIDSKLEWDKISLEMALKTKDIAINEFLPSLYLNVAKCYEDMRDLTNAAIHYQAALSYSIFLSSDGYSNMIKSGIIRGIKRVTNN